ncbi:MAG: hypothetical protein HQ521_03475 [Bacteroidetes bacterium]|nr:hypothetical protein [Bacteroidota bacterium]
MYDRQFIIAPGKYLKKLDWEKIIISPELELKTHPSLETSECVSKQGRIILLGYILDTSNPELNNRQIIEDLINNSHDINSLCKLLYKLSGRFVIIYITINMMYMLHDLAGLRSIYWAQTVEGDFIFASQPSHIAVVMKYKYSNYALKYFIQTDYFKKDQEYWFPGPLTLYKEITQLLPNHYLDVNNNTQIRFWPNKLKYYNSPEAIVKKSVEIIKNTIRSASLRYELAIPITSGYDSRIVLAATSHDSEKYYYYVCLYGDTSKKSNDIVIPQKILNKMGVKYNIIDCNGKMDDEYMDYYKNNCYLAHNYYGDIAYMLKTKYPANRLDVRGVSETFRSFYFNKTVRNGQDLANIARMGDGKLAIKSLQKWLDDSTRIIQNNNYNLLDIFYLEQRLGSWRSISALEWDGIRELFDPFNCRYLLDLMLSVDERYRIGKHKLFKMIITEMNPTLLDYPINPDRGIKKVKRIIINLLNELDLLLFLHTKYKSIYKR